MAVVNSARANPRRKESRLPLAAAEGVQECQPQSLESAESHPRVQEYLATPFQERHDSPRKPPRSSNTRQV